MLEVDKLNVSYGVIPVLHDVSFYVKEYEIVTSLVLMERAKALY